MWQKLRWPLLIVLLALVAIGFLLINQQPVLQPALAPVVEPATGGVYTEGLIGAMVRLNPLLDYYNSVDRDVDRLLFSGLVRFDDRGLPQGDLADSWGISKDGMVYNFSIRANAVWHDLEPVTSDDVIFTIERMREDESPLPDDLRALWKQVEVVRLDEKTLQFRLPEPFSPFLDYLTFGVLPKHLMGDLTLQEMIDSPLNLKPIGSGPYQFDQIIAAGDQVAGVVLKAFPEYYGRRPYIEQLAFRYYPDSASALAAYRAGEILGISQVPMDILMPALQESNLNIHTGRLPEITMIFLNLGNQQVPYFQEAAIRKALLSGLNRQRLIDRLLNGQALVANGPIFPGTWAYYEGAESIAYEPEAAKEALRKAGYTIPAEGGNIRQNTDGVALSFTLLHIDDTEAAAIAQAIREDWLQIGVEVTLSPVSFEDMAAALDNRLYQAALVTLNLSRSPDPDPYPFWHQAQKVGGQNYSQWDDRQASEYLEQARVTVDLTERTRLYRNFQVRFSQELPALPLYYPVYRYAVDASVQGVRMGPLFDSSDRYNTIAEWYLVTRRSSGESSPTLTPSPAP